MDILAKVVADRVVAQACLHALRDAGYAVVPMAPTSEMVEAAEDARREADAWINDPWWMEDWLQKRLPTMWPAMVEAAQGHETKKARRPG